MKTLFSIILIAFLIILHGNALAINAKTNVGPALAGWRLRDNTHNIFLFFKGHNNKYIWEAVYNSSTRQWTSRGRIRDRIRNSWALTSAEPVAASTNKIYFRGHNNSRIWCYSRTRSNAAWESKGHMSCWYRALSEPKITYTHFSPSVMSWDWDTIQSPSIIGAPPNLNVVFTKCDNRIYFQSSRDSGHVHPGVSEWRCAFPLPDEYKTNMAPTCYDIGGSFGVFYQAIGSDENGSHIRFCKRENNVIEYNNDTWSGCSLPRAYTNKKIAVTYYASFSGLLVAYTGHNNPKIWLRLYKQEYGDILEPRSWRRLGYIAGIETSESPALIGVGNGPSLDDGRTFYLAFKPVHGPEISVGILEINENNRRDTAGHTYRSIRYDR